MNNHLLWIFAAVAMASTLGGVVWVLAPLGRAQRRGAGVLALSVPVFAIALYFSLGSPKALDAVAQRPAHEQATPDLQAMVNRLEERLQAAPTNVEGWFMLARSHQVLEQWDKSADAYRQALALAPDDPDLLADLADVLGVIANGNLEGEPRALLNHALRAEPGHAKSLLLLAAAEIRAGRPEQAKAHWQALLRTAPAESQAATIARDSLMRLESAGSAQWQPPATPEPSGGTR